MTIAEPGAADEPANPPTAEQVLRRALALTAVSARAMLEQHTATPEAPGTYRDLLAWVRDMGMDEFEPDEWEELQRTGQHHGLLSPPAPVAVSALAGLASGW